MTTTPVSVIVVDDHSLVRESVVRAVEVEPGFHVVGEGADGQEALDLVDRLHPDVLVLDITMPGIDGLEAASRVRQRHPGTAVLLLTMHEDEATVRAAMGAGVAGYVPKRSDLDELLNALRTVAAGENYVAGSVARLVMQLASGRRAGPVALLTSRELEILRSLAAGNRPGTIAEQLHLSVKTVKNHLTTVYAKLGVETAAQAVGEAYRLGLANDVARP